MLSISQPPSRVHSFMHRSSATTPVPRPTLSPIRTSQSHLGNRAHPYQQHQHSLSSSSFAWTPSAQDSASAPLSNGPPIYPAQSSASGASVIAGGLDLPFLPSAVDDSLPPSAYNNNNNNDNIPPQSAIVVSSSLYAGGGPSSGELESSLTPSLSPDNKSKPARGRSKSTANARSSAAAGGGPGAGVGRNAQPKSSRKQFSACGACQLRQVKCDLKDKAGENPSCSACIERGVNCVSVYAANTKPKAQRRGRRLRVVERVYGKTPGSNDDGGGPLPPHSASDLNDYGLRAISAGADGSHSFPPVDPDPSLTSLARPPHLVSSIIPALRPEFLDSPFYRSFHTQRPIIDPHEFRERFMASFQGRPEALGVTGQLLANCLVTWAASYGINEYGESHPTDPSNSPEQEAEVQKANIRSWRAKCTDMVKEMLESVDRLALLRKPTWDGVRILMLIMPLTEDALGTVDRLSMYQCTIGQIYTLCAHGGSLLTNGPQNKMVIARIFWYAYVHEGITSGLRGRKLVFDNDDLKVFEATMPKMRAGGEGGMALTAMPILDRFAFKFSTAPIRLSTACRQINHALTGPKASMRRDVDEAQLRDGWEKLAACWDEFEELKALVSESGGFMLRPDMERFISGWQIFLFECHNVIREALKEKLRSPRSQSSSAFVSEEPESPEHNINHDTHTNVSRLHELAESHCADLHSRVIELIRRQLDSPTFFQWDASLVRDGTFYAGNWAAAEPTGRQDDVDTCLHALRLMQWAFSLSDVRAQTIRYTYAKRIYGTEGAAAAFTDAPTLLRDPALFTGAHLPSGPDSGVGLVGSDLFEHFYNQSQSSTRPGTMNNLSHPRSMPVSPDDYYQRYRASPSVPHHSNGIMNASLDSRHPQHAQQQSGWNSNWLNSTYGPQYPPVNSIPASKLGRASPDELEASRMSPGGSSHHSSASSGEFVGQGQLASTSRYLPEPLRDGQAHTFNHPSHPYQPVQQWNEVPSNGNLPPLTNSARREPSDGSVGSHRSHDHERMQPNNSSFVRIDATAQGSYPYQRPTHESNGVGHYVQPASFPGGTVDEPSEVLYMAEPQLNRTRYPF